MKCEFIGIMFSIICFHLTVDNVGPSKWKVLQLKYLKHWLCLPHSATCVILNYPGVCCPSVSLISRQCKLSLLANISISSEPLIQELALQLDLSSGFLQIDSIHQEILSQARAQLSGIPTACKLYTAGRRLAILNEAKFCQQKLNSLTLQCKFEQSAILEAELHLWN